jgi:hypothetical protein
MTHPLVDEVLRRLNAPPPDHARFVGAPIDIRELGPFDLGRLWPSLQRTIRATDRPVAQELARGLVAQARKAGLTPAFDAQASIEAFRVIDRWDEAIENLSYLACEPSAELASEVRRILADGAPDLLRSADRRYQELVLARVAGDDSLDTLRATHKRQFVADDFVLDELEALARVGFSSALALAGGRSSYFWADEAEENGDPAGPLSEEAAYAMFVHTALARAAAVIEDIHAGRAPYAADRAFSLDDAHIIARAVRVAALRDEPWFGDVIARLLPGVCVAPTKAKTMPSQAMAVALGHAIEAVPTPESVRALRGALRCIRHEGVKKKLSRNLKPAERALAARPDLALRLGTSEASGKRQETMLATCLESGFWQGLDFEWEEWQKRLLETPGGGPLARSLIWMASSPGVATRSFMPAPWPDAPSLVDCRGDACTVPPGARVSLWHPVRAEDAERAGWQTLIADRHIRQPIRQAFRERYVPSEQELEEHRSDAFAGHVLALRPLVGLARREGWRASWDGLARRFGVFRVRFAVTATLYPGVVGSAESRAMTFQTGERGAWQEVQIADVPPILFSEACRAVDLLVSVSSFALGVAGPEPLSVEQKEARARRWKRLDTLSTLAKDDFAAMVEVRREALRHAFAPQIADGRVVLAPRQVLVGQHAVHLATARVTRAGAAVEVDLAGAPASLAALPWLPYDEVLLERIAHTISALL